MRQLALEALSQPQAAREDSDLRSRFRSQLAAGQYAEAVRTLSAWRARHPRRGFDRDILLEIYGTAKATQAQEHLSFQEAFARAFATVFRELDDKTALDSEHFFQTPSRVLAEQLDRLLTQFKDHKNLVSADADSLILAYLLTEAQQNVAPYLPGAETRDDALRFDIEDEVLIKTREGATLSAVVVRKKGVRAPQPASLRFTIYVDPAANHLAKVAAIHGYAGVVGYARGKRSSPDAIEPWEHETQDTYAVIDWISRQPWSNGKVGMYGASYDGFTQWAAAKNLHPALKTIVPGSASLAGFGLPMQNNVFQSANYAWPFYVMDNRELDEATYNQNDRWNILPNKWYVSGRPYREIDALDGKPNPLLQKQLQHPSFDSYWQAMQPYKSDYAKIDIPVLTMTGYYDDANSAAVNYLIEHYRYNPRANHYLVIGPYPHASSLRSSVPPVVKGYSIDPAAQIDSLELTYQWFDYVMKEGPRPELLKDRINFEVMGANLWRHASSMDAMSNDSLTLYLTNEKRGEQFHLASTKPKRTGYLEQTIDLADRSSEVSLFPAAAITAMPKIASGFTFVSDPLDAPMSVAGLITSKLDVSINKRDMDITLGAYELMPDGTLFWLAYYLGRASYAEDMGVRKLLTPGVRTVIPVTRTPLVIRQMSKGSRLVLLLTVNKNPWAQVNYGTGRDVSSESITDAKEPLKVHWYTDSFIKVPIWR